MILLILGLLAAVNATPAVDKESYKDQYCTDPRTMRKHAAYTEWADAYSCTRHRCQPGGRNLAIYTVGCKRVEAPESAIECEEVVEDTNMQFPFCCTRLRCLVVVRGEVWTRVLGQPWEVLPAAPWSHMYKMKKPPPADSTFLPKTNEQGPVYELTENEDTGGHDKVLRSGKKPVTDPDCNEIEPRAAPPPPDIVIALSTNNEMKEPLQKKYENSRRSQSKHENSRHKRARKTTPSTPAQYFEEEQRENKEREKRIEPEIQEVEEIPTSTDKPPEMSAEKFFANNYADSQKTSSKYGSQNPVSWTEIPQNQWNDPHEGLELENRVSEPQIYQAQDTQPQDMPEPKVQGINALMSANEEKPTNLQALVDAIGTRMRDIESVVQKMSEKVHQVKPGVESSAEKRISAELEEAHRLHKDPKRPNADGDNYRRFSVLSNRGSKYLHSASDSTAEPPLIIGDTNLTGYFSDASNSVLRRSAQPKEPPPTYMAPVENHKSKVPVHIAVVSDNLEDTEKKKKKHSHKKRRGKGSHSHKKHHSKDDKRKHFNRFSSGEVDKNVVSLEDSSAITKK